MGDPPGTMSGAARQNRGGTGRNPERDSREQTREILRRGLQDPAVRFEDPEWGPGILGWYLEALGGKLAERLCGRVCRP